MSRRTLVTGANGLIGSYVVKKLLNAGEPVRVMVRRVESVAPEVRERVQIALGDIRDASALAAAVQGSDTIIHLAACARAWSRDPGEFFDVNVRAVESLLDLARAEGIDCFVHVSTILTLVTRCGSSGEAGSRVPTPYELTKRQGEGLVEEYAREGHHAVIVHPTRVYGPGPLHDANALTKAMGRYLRSPLWFRLADSDVLGNYVHVDDVASGILLAARHGQSGAHYILGGENRSVRGLMDTVADLAGARPVVVPIPRSLALAVAGASVAWGWLGGKVLLTPRWVESFLEDQPADIESACHELGYAPRPLREGLAQTIEWLRQAGHGRTS